MAGEKANPKGQAWFCTAGLPSDVVIEVDDMTFHLHKFPLMSRSRKLHNMITEQQEKQPPRKPTTRIQQIDNDRGEKQEIEIKEDDEQYHILLPNFPGGSEAFEAAAKFCYGVKYELSANNVAPLRCAGEYLEMTEEYSEDNLISKCERFISQTVLRSIKHSIGTLISCQSISPAAESLGIVQRCIEAIASKAAAAASDPSLFGWPVNDAGGVNTAAAGESWLDELRFLKLPLFNRLISAMKASDLSPEIIESCLIHYAKRQIPGISRTVRKPSSSSTENEQRELIEAVISNLPTRRTAASHTTAQFLLGLLRTAYILNASESCRSTLEKKIGSQLEMASLDDLLIPSYSYLNETLYDVDCVERILSFFLQGVEDEDDDSGGGSIMVVGKLIDGYLSEIASDANLKPEKFYNLAVALPDNARLFDDGLYRAVDVYLKAHPWIPEAEREKICGVLDCQKLTLEACTHAAQNERLPIRAVVQVLFFEQLQLRQAIAGTLMAADSRMLEDGQLSSHGEEVGNEAGEMVERVQGVGNTWRATVRENRVLWQDMDTMKTRVHELEKECTSMKKVIQKIDKMGPRERGEKGGWRAKFGCKFKTQVCDSHERSVVDTRKSSRGHRRE